MDITAIINNAINYASIILGILFAFSIAVNLIVEVVKRLVPKVPTDLVVFVVSIALTVLALFILAEVLTITVMWHYAVGAVFMGFIVAYIAMNDFDKFTALWNRLMDFWKNRTV